MGRFKKYLAGLGIALVASSLVVFILSEWGLFKQIELLLLNLRQSVRYAKMEDSSLAENIMLKSAHEGKHPSIEIIKMDEFAFSKFGAYPWPRSTYAKPLEKFSRGQLTVTLSWNGIDTPEHQGYCVYQSEIPIKTSQDLNQARLAQTLKCDDDQVFVDLLITQAGRWYFAVTSFDTNGIENRAIHFKTNSTAFPVEIRIKPDLEAEAWAWNQEYQLGLEAFYPRDFHENLEQKTISALNAELAYPEAIFFDIFFLDQKDARDDQVFYRSLAKNSGIFVDYSLVDDAGERPNPEDYSERLEAVQRFSLSAEQDDQNQVIRDPNVNLPIPEILTNVDGAGFANAIRDSDEVVRSWKLVSRFESDKYPNRYYPSAPLLLAMRHFRVPPERVRIEIGEAITLLDAEYRHFDQEGRLTNVSYQDLKIPIDQEGILDIHFVGPPKTFVEFADEFSSFSFFDKYSLSSLSRKIYMIGLYEQAIKTDDKTTDYWMTPMGYMFGIEIMANTLNTIITGNFLARASFSTNALIVFLITIFLSLALTRLSILKGAFFTTIINLVFIVIAYIAYTDDLIINMGMPLVGMLLTFLGTTVYKTMTEEAEKKYIRTQFSKFVNKSVVDSLLKDPAKLKLGGERRVMSVLFSDIRGFTTLSEGLGAEELVQLLNSYLSRMTDIVFKYEGTLDKYVGDEIMAFWGAPLIQDEHAWLACQTALEMLEALAELNASLPEGKRLKIGIGINTGEMLVGQIGSESRMDYTVIGDNVNLGARLEGTNKVYGTGIIINESTLEHVKDRVIVRELDKVRVKGKTKPVTIYELLALASS